MAQKMHLGLTAWNRILGELISQVFEGELQTGRENLSVGDSFGKIREQPLHLRGRFQVALRITGEKAASGFEPAMMANAGENVEQFALVRQCVTHAIGSEQGQRQ